MYEVGDLIEFDELRWRIKNIIHDICCISDIKDAEHYYIVPLKDVKLIHRIDENKFKLGSLDNRVVQYFKDRDIIIVKEDDDRIIYSFSKLKKANFKQK